MNDLICPRCHQAVPQVTPQECEDMLVTAIESGYYGIGYWAEEVDTSEVRYWDFDEENPRPLWRDGGRVRIKPEDEEFLDLDVRLMEDGIRKAAAHFGLTLRNFIDNQDGDSADVAVQFALFGEIVYG